MSDRLSKLNDLLRDEVARAAKTELEEELNTLITVTGADVSPTLEHATIKISVYPPRKEEVALTQLNEKIYNIQQAINRRLKMRPVPKIRFEIDRSRLNAEKIEKVLQKIVE